MLGWTKVVESYVVGSPHIHRWVLYASLMTVIWVGGVVIYETVEETVEDATDG
jgi:hypothetical protein